MALYHYSTTKAAALSTGMTAGDTIAYLVDGSTFPDPAVPGNGEYTVILGYGSDREEVCTVTGKPGVDSLTVTRAQDGTSATTKNSGDIVVHGVSARDFEGYVLKAGSTMTGALVLSGAPTADLHPATKKYTDDALALKAPLASPTFTGNVIVPTADAANEAVNKAQLDEAMPLGSIIAYGGSTAPTGWHLCNGTAHGSSALQTLIGSANTPDLRDKFILGDGGALPNTGGVTTVTLSAAQSGLVGHNHTGSSVAETQEHTHWVDPPATESYGHSADHSHGIVVDGNHAHGSVLKPYNGVNQDWGATWGTGTAVYQSWGITGDGGSHNHNGGTTGASVGHSHTVEIAGFGSGGRSASHTHGVTVNSVAAAAATTAHENMPPYYALTYIIKKV